MYATMVCGVGQCETVISSRNREYSNAAPRKYAIPYTDKCGVITNLPKWCLVKHHGGDRRRSRKADRGGHGCTEAGAVDIQEVVSHEDTSTVIPVM